jgi:hypothetical protein
MHYSLVRCLRSFARARLTATRVKTAASRVFTPLTVACPRRAADAPTPQAAGAVAAADSRSPQLQLNVSSATCPDSLGLAAMAPNSHVLPLTAKQDTNSCAARLRARCARVSFSRRSSTLCVGGVVAETSPVTSSTCHLWRSLHTVEDLGGTPPPWQGGGPGHCAELGDLTFQIFTNL